jgi:hypothetical protein
MNFILLIKKLIFIRDVELPGETNKKASSDEEARIL